MKVVIINRHAGDNLGGSELQCDIIAAGLTARGHEVTYLALYAKPHEYGLSYRVVNPGAPTFRNLRRAIAAARPDVVYWRHGKIGLLGAAVAAKLVGARFVHSLSHVADGLPWRSTYGGRFPRLPWPPAPRALALWGLKVVDPLRQTLNFMAIPLFTDAVVSNNRDFLAGVPSTNRHVIHNSMRTDAVPFTWPRPFVVWVANIKARKRPDDFFRLSQALRDTGVDFVMVGAVHDTAYHERLTEWSKAENFHYLGSKSLAEVNGILAASLLLTHTCDPEGFPNNCIQAWLQGKPVVSLRFDPEGLLEGARLGRFSRDFVTFCDDVRTLIHNEKLRLELGERSRAYAVNEFAESKNVSRLESLLQALHGMKSRAGGA